MKQEINLLIQYETWDFIPTFDIEPSYYLLKEKWIYKIKHVVNNLITHFKAR